MSGCSNRGTPSTRHAAAAADRTASSASTDISATWFGGSWRRTQVVFLPHVVVVHHEIVVRFSVVSGRPQHHLHVAVLVENGGVFQPLEDEGFLRSHDED